MKNLYAALIKFQSQLKPIAKTKKEYAALRGESRIIPEISNKINPIKRTNGTTALPYPQRFFEKICFGISDCWYWRGSQDHAGYGWMGAIKAHRKSWELFRDKIPKGKFVLHKCDIPNCVNPDHLFLGTKKDNMQDCLKKGRIRRLGVRGEENGCSVLTNKTVLKMRAIREKTGLTYKEIGKKFGVSETHAWRVITKRGWAHI